MSSNFHMPFPDILPTWNCQWEDMKCLLIYVVNESPFETDGRIRSSFQMKCLTRSRYTPWYLSDEVTKVRCEFTFSDEVPRSGIRYTSLVLVRWSDKGKMWVHIFRWSTQISYQIYILVLVRWSDKGKMWVHIFRWSTQIRYQIYLPRTCQMKWQISDVI